MVGANRYYIYRSTSSAQGGSGLPSPTATPDSDDSCFLDDNFPPDGLLTYYDNPPSYNTTYYYVVTADLSSPPNSTTIHGNPSSVVSGQASVIPAPTGVVATAGTGGKITISWNGVAAANRYYIYRSTNPATGGSGSGLLPSGTSQPTTSATNWAAYLGNTVPNSGATTYTDTTAVPGVTYYYAVSSVNNGFNYGVHHQADYIAHGYASTPAPLVTVGLATSTVTVTPASIASGSTATVTLTAKDPNGNQLTSGGLTVTFSLAGSGAGISNGTFSTPTTDNGNGTYTATFTGTVAGSPNTIQAAVANVGNVTSTPSITVTPGPVSLATSTVTVTPASIASGSTATVTLTAKDANGNQETSGGLTVTFSLVGSGAGISNGTFSPTTDNGNGTYTATFTGTTAGTPNTIQAAIATVGNVSSTPTITVTPGPVSLTTSTVTVAPASIASGSTATVTLTAKDANGNQETSGGLTVTFSMVSSGAGISNGTFSTPTTDHGDGTYTATFTGTTAGNPNNIQAAIATVGNVSSTPSITVTPGPISLAQSTVTVSPASITLGSTATVTLTAKDAAGNQETSGGKTVTFSLVSSGTGISSGTFPSSGTATDHGNGTYTATFTSTAAGNPNNIQAAIATVGNVSSTPSITVTPLAAPTSLTATGGTNQVSLSWAASPGATSYQIYRSTAPGTETKVAGATTATTTYTDNSPSVSLLPGYTFYYKVAAVNGAVTSAESTEASAPTAPPAPSLTSATAADGQITLIWAAAKGATSYQIYRGTVTGTETAVTGATSTTTTYTDTGLISSTKYFYKVAAVNSGGPSPLSGEKSATYSASMSPASVTVVNGGGPIGDTYAPGNMLTVVGGGGTGMIPAVLTVGTVSGGQVASVSVSNPGYYPTSPANPVATTDSVGTATGATFNLTIAPLVYAPSGGVIATIPGGATTPSSGALMGTGTSTNVIVEAVKYSSTSSTTGTFSLQFNNGFTLSYTPPALNPLPVSPSVGDAYNVTQITLSQTIAAGTSANVGSAGTFANGWGKPSQTLSDYYNAFWTNEDTPVYTLTTVTTPYTYVETQAATSGSPAIPAKYTFTFTAGDTPMGPTNYLGNAGMYYFNYDTSSSGSGAFSAGPYYADSVTRLTDISDGTSNTIAFGEALGGSENEAPTYGLTWMGTGVMPSYWDCQTPAMWFTFGSNHPGVVNFAFCDGSVRSITKVTATDKTSIPPPDPPAAAGTPRWTAFQSVAGMTDGKTPDWNPLGSGAAGN